MILFSKPALTLVLLIAALFLSSSRALQSQQSLSSANQSPETLPKFDAISIKLHHGGPNLGLNLARSGGHVELSADLRTLMILAYGLHSLSQAIDTIVGMPNWGTGEGFDIEAEAPGNPTIGQKRLMLQSLLADRFKMVMHRETRQEPVYALVVAKPGKLGPQLHADAADGACNAAGSSAQQSSAKDASPASIALQDLQKFPCGRVAGGLLTPGDHIQVWSGGRNVSMDAITNAVGEMEYMDHPVVNRTGLAGAFDYTVEWDSRTDTEDLSASPAPLERGPVSTEPIGSSLLEAMREQLGLKLDLQKGPVDVIVIDHVEQPTQN
jgi:uncharacterized protein (TIGR03435 family)